MISTGMALTTPRPPLLYTIVPCGKGPGRWRELKDGRERVERASRNERERDEEKEG